LILIHDELQKIRIAPKARVNPNQSAKIKRGGICSRQMSLLTELGLIIAPSL
jgi:hypothetical protein